MCYIVWSVQDKNIQRKTSVTPTYTSGLSEVTP